MANTEKLFQNKQGETFRISAGIFTNVNKIISEREKLGDAVIAIGSPSEITKMSSQNNSGDSCSANDQWRR